VIAEYMEGMMSDDFPSAHRETVRKTRSLFTP
jgi:hypothetical protein